MQSDDDDGEERDGTHEDDCSPPTRHGRETTPSQPATRPDLRRGVGVLPETGRALSRQGCKAGQRAEDVADPMPDDVRLVDRLVECALDGVDVVADLSDRRRRGTTAEVEGVGGVDSPVVVGMQIDVRAELAMRINRAAGFAEDRWLKYDP